MTDPRHAAVRILPTVTDPDFVLYVGDVREVLAELESESVHCVVTSPPYWGLRDYGTGLWEGGNPDCDHVQQRRTSDKTTIGRSNGRDHRPAVDAPSMSLGLPFAETCGKCGACRIDQQLGLEPTPDQYIHNMVGVFREVRRVLRRDGTLWLNIGDSYAGQANGRSRFGQGGSDKTIKRPGYEAQNEGSTVNRPLPDGLKQKDLCGIPWRLAFGLQQDGWYLRAEIIWAKPNPMPESVTDRPTKAHEQVFLLTRSPRYFYDADAVREPHNDRNYPDGYTGKNGISRPEYDGSHRDDGSGSTRTPLKVTNRQYDARGRNLRSVWEIPTEPFPQAHFATYPQALVERCVKAGTSEHGCCPECGAPWEREISRTFVKHQNILNTNPSAPRGVFGNQGDNRAADGHLPGHYDVETLGWKPTCRHWTIGHMPLPPVPCTVFDPFIGSGTTALVARRLGRKCLGIELSPVYAQICLDRTRQLSLLAEVSA